MAWTLRWMGFKSGRPFFYSVQIVQAPEAHADEPQLLAWLRNFVSSASTDGSRSPAPKRVFLVHGEPDAQAAIEPKIEALGLPTTIPRWRERITLD